jgi:hypothetical protein
VLDLNLADSTLFSANALNIYQQYKDCAEFNIPIITNIDIDIIKGFDIGHIFTINVQAPGNERIRFGIEPKSTAGNGEIIDGA